MIQFFFSVMRNKYFYFNGYGQGSALYDCLLKWKKKRKLLLCSKYSKFVCRNKSLVWNSNVDYLKWNSFENDK